MASPAASAIRGWPQTGFQKGRHQGSRMGRDGSVRRRDWMPARSPDQSGSAMPGAAPFTAARSAAKRSTSARHPAQAAT